MIAITRRVFIASTVTAGCMAVVVPPAGWSKHSQEGGGIIDSHVHVWTGDTEKFPLAPGFTKEHLWLPSYTPDDILKDARSLGVRRLNLVQMTWYGLDHSYILDLIAKDPKNLVGTGIVPAVTDVAGPSPDDTMIALSKKGVFAFRIRGRMARPP